MSEFIHCDGPDCEHRFRVGAAPLDWLKVDIIDFDHMTVYGTASTPPWHFCSARCCSTFMVKRMPVRTP